MTIAIIVNALVFLFTIASMIICAWLLQLRGQSLLLFILYAIFWVGPLMCRDYAGLMHVHLDLNFTKYMLFVPIMVNGLVGLFWKPLNDVLSIKWNSRKAMLFIAVIAQILTSIPFVIWPSFTTNVIQSVGTGIGVSVLGLFILMFQQHTPNRRVFSTVNILALPPIFAQITASAIISLVTGLLRKGSSGSEYVSTMWLLWVDAIFFFVIAFILIFFVKEDRTQVVTLISRNKIEIYHSSQKWTLGLCCFVAILILFIKWATAGPIASIQVAYLSMQPDGVDTRGFEGYAGVIYAAGQLIGSIFSMWIINIAHNKGGAKILVLLLALISSSTYLYVSANYANIPVYFGTASLNGFSYGLVYPILVATVSLFCFSRSYLITPVAIYNTCMSVGLTMGAFFGAYLKGDVFLDIARQPSEWQFTFDYFVDVCRFVNMICFGCALLAGLCYSINLIIERSYSEYYIPPKPKSIVDKRAL